MCIKFGRSTPRPTEYEISYTELFSLAQATFPAAQTSLWDQRFWYASLIDWGAIFTDVLINIPGYTVDKFDCENFGKQVSCRVDAHYMLNTCGIAIGASPMGYHGFNVFVARVEDAPKLYILEPQTADIYAPEDESGYIPDTILLG